MIHRAAPLVPMPMQPAQPLPVISRRAWDSSQLHKHLRQLEDNLLLLKALKNEVGVLLSLEGNQKPDSVPSREIPPLQESYPSLAATFQQTQVRSPDAAYRCVVDDEYRVVDNCSRNLETQDASKCLEVINIPTGLELMRTVMLDAVEKQAGEIDGRKLAVSCAAKGLSRHVRSLLASFELDQSAVGGSDKSGMIAMVAKKRLKVKRNRRWRSKRRQQAAVALQKENAEFEKLDAQADAWRAREIAQDISMRKMEHMKAIAEQKAKEDRLRRVQEQEMGILVEKLHELRSLRIQKLKKQGKFFPDEDNEFLERIRLAVEEEERLAAAAADTSAATTAIANASVAAKAVPPAEVSTVAQGLPDGREEIQVQQGSMHPETSSRAESTLRQGLGGDQQDIRESFHHRGLPPEFYHYYYGSSFDMGALIEVRRSWDALIVPAGGSRIPGHWVQAPVPADAVWASYLVKPTIVIPPRDIRKVQTA